MSKYSFFIRLALCLLAFCYGTLGLSAEPTGELKTTFTGGTNQVTGKDGNFHALRIPTAGKATFTLSFNETDSICDNTISVTFSIKRDETVVKKENITCTVSKGKITKINNPGDFTSFGTSGEYQMSCEIKYSKKPFGKNVDPTPVTFNIDADKKIFIYDNPKVTQVDPKEYVVLHNTPITTNPLTLTGGYGEGWQFVWYQSTNKDQQGTKISNQNESSIKNYNVTNTTNEVKTIYLNVYPTNTAPNGTTSWYNNIKIQYKITIYPTPVATLKPGETVNILTGKSTTLEWSTTPNNTALWGTPTWELTANAGGSGNVSGNKYVFKGANAGPNGKKISKVKTKVVYANNQTEPIRQEFEKTATINVWPNPKILYPAAADTTVYTYDGQKDKLLSGTTQGGYTDSNDAWTFTWTINNGKTTTTKTTNIFECPVTFYNDGDDPIDVVCTVKASNKCNGQEWLTTNNTRTFHVRIFPHMSLDVESKVNRKDDAALIPSSDKITYNNKTINCYEGDKITLTATAEGGRAGKWTYKWDKNSYNSATYTKTVERLNGENPYVMTLTIVAKNEYQDGEYFPIDETYKVNVYSRGNVKAEPLDSALVNDRHHYLNGSNIIMKSTPSGGYNAGWDYTWLDGSTAISGKKDKDCTLIANNPGNTYVDKTYKLIAVNKIGQNVGFSNSNNPITYDKIRIWPSIQFHTDINCDKAYILENKKVREGDEFTLSVTKATGGYQPTGNYAYNFNYQWRNEESKTESYYYEENSKVGNKKSATREKDYFVEIWQNGPYGNEWGRAASSNMKIKFYPCPQIPVSVVRKGNGTTQTLIVMNGTADDNNGNNPMIVNDDYTYRFGYTDISGQDYLSKPKTKRWFRLNPDYFEGTSASDFNSADARLWVIAEWQYEDGVTVTSGRVFVDKPSEPYFNASSFFYGGNASSQAPRFLPFHEGKDVDGINTVIANASAISIVGDMLMINFDSPTDATINIYNLSGSCLKTINVYGQSSVNEPLNLNSLSKGVYLVETLTNGIRDIKKIIIR